MRFKRVYVEITNACNRRCAFCPPHGRPETYMSLSAFARVLDAVAPYARHLYFHLMGEPLLHPQVEDMAALAHGRGFYVNLTTNGDLLDSRPDLLRHVRQLNVSLHGHPEPGALVRRLAGIRDTAVCLRLWDGGRNAEIEALLEEMFGVPLGDKPRVKLRENMYLSRAERFEWPDLSRPPLYPDGYCYGLKQQIGILADGTAVPCCLDGAGCIPLGNVFAEGLDGPLRSPRAAALMEGFRRRKAIEALCRTCSYKNRFH